MSSPVTIYTLKKTDVLILRSYRLSFFNFMCALQLLLKLILLTMNCTYRDIKKPWFVTAPCSMLLKISFLNGFCYLNNTFRCQK